jgi:FlaA1/EpsC-like NDP-sugar epimerase
MQHFFQKKVVLVTGAAGSVGQELVRQLLCCQPGEIRAVDNNETELFLLGERYQHAPEVKVHLGDVRDPRKMEDLCPGADVILHAAAFKHVGLSECNPFDAVQTNILGVKNIIQAARRQRVGLVIFTSSDKAVNPTNVMGASKLVGERLVTAANLVSDNGRQVFASVRFGNVMGSRGSVVPIFADQIKRGAPVTVTDINMTRFFMTLQEAARLVLEACTLACGGEVFVTKMPVMRILDLAQAMIELLGPLYDFNLQEARIQFIGVRSGEKLYEELLSAEEISRTRELEEMFVILPALKSFSGRISYSYEDETERPVVHPYISSQEQRLTVEEIKHFLLNHKVLADFISPPLEAGLTPDRLPARKWKNLTAVH